MKLALAQLNPTVGDVDGNLSQLLKILKSKQSQSSDLLIFPELYLSGYPTKDLLEYDSFLDKIDLAVNTILESSEAHPHCGILFGAPRRKAGGKGKGLVNSALLVHGGSLIAQVNKCLLPTYDVFDEARYFDAAKSTKPVQFKGEKLGISICEDAWNDPEIWDRPLYPYDPIDHLAELGATILINISASPFGIGKDRIRFNLVKNYAKRHRLPFIMVNQIGGNDELVFDGTSMAVDSEGQLVMQLSSFNSQVRSLDLKAQLEGTTFVEMDKIGSIYNALVLGIKDYVRKCGFTDVLIGLSGGIDSSLTCVLAVAALGKDRVMGVMMPSPFSSRESVEDSENLANRLGISVKKIPINAIYEEYRSELASHFEGREPDVAEENIQARIRGNILMALSNKFGSLVLSTGNKSELAMGYCTLYGDMSGGLAVLSDVPKTMVYELARLINKEGEIIPQSVMTKPPSAELRPNQKDEDSLPRYGVLDRILVQYLEQNKSAREIISSGIDSEVVESVIRTVDANEYKRRQAAPGIKITSKAFGSGRRMPIAAVYKH